MLDRLILHIGDHKTGTTSIQDFCFAHRGALAQQGINYPNDGAITTSGHHALQSWLTQPRGKPPRTKFDLEAVAPLWLDRFDGATVFLSSENLRFLKVNQIKKLAALLPARQVQVIAYFRAPLDRFLSGYKQHVKSSESRCSMGVAEFMDALNYDKVVDYSVVIDRWAEVYGREAVNVRSFRAAKGGIVRDLLTTIGVDPDRLPAPHKPSNVSPDDLTIAALAVLNNAPRSVVQHAAILRALMETARPDDKAYGLLAGPHFTEIRDRLIGPIRQLENAEALGLLDDDRFETAVPIGIETVQERIRRIREFLRALDILI